MFRAQYRITKAELNQSRLSESEILQYHTKHLEVKHKVGGGVNCFLREEGKTFVLFHFVNNDCSEREKKIMLQVLQELPTKDL